MKIKLLAVNATVAALYVALAFAVKPIAFGELQFRIPEIFNHLIAFNPLFMPGVELGVFISNINSELGPIDLVFGVGHSVITLGLAIFIFKFVSNIKVRLAIMTVLFTLTMFIIAFELSLVLKLPFFWTWLFVAGGEFVVLAIGAPIMYTLNKRLDFKNML